MVFCSPWAPSLYYSIVFHNVLVFCYVSFISDISTTVAAKVETRAVMKFRFENSGFSYQKGIEAENRVLLPI